MVNEELQKWYLDNCGVIIVHPFLKQLFTELDYLVGNGQFRSEQIRQRAVLLVHFIATGEEGFNSESELAMSKVLCGMSISGAVDASIELDDGEKNNAEDMLIAIINHWDRIGKTSPDGLRNTFFRREGILERKDGVLQLAIDKRGTDILLDYLPWNISIIQFPWTDHLIYTSWR